MKSKCSARKTCALTGGSSGSRPISFSKAGVGNLFYLLIKNLISILSVSLLTSIFLLIIMPFTFFLIEADGFSWGPPKGIRARLYETVITCLLLLVLVVFFLFVIVSRNFRTIDVHMGSVTHLSKMGKI